jgi:Flp pilus assembly protein CpaB
MRLLEILLVLVALSASGVLGWLALHVWSADASDIEHLRRDLAYGWLLIQAAPVIALACVLAVVCALGALVFIARRSVVAGKPAVSD